MVHKLMNGIITDKTTNNFKLYNTIYKDGKLKNLPFFITYYFKKISKFKINMKKLI